MRPFIFDNREFRSLKEFADIYQVSYSKIRRYCRHYLRASKDPAVACEWLLGRKKRSPFETKTFKYAQDLEKGAERNLAYLERHSAEIQLEKERKHFLKMVMG